MSTAKPTLTDIARRASVSVSVASRALHGVGRVNDDTRERVRAAAEELGYVKHLRDTVKTGGNRTGEPEPGFGARGSKLVGILITSIDNRDAIRVASSAQKRLAARGFATIVLEGTNMAGTDGIPAQYQGLPIGGLIVVGSAIDDELVRRLAGLLPVVVAGRSVHGRTCVTIDTRQAVGRLIDRLQRSGHRSVTWLAPVEPSPLVTAFAKQVFTQAAQLSLRCVTQPDCGRDMAAGMAAWQRFRHTPTDAVIAADDDVAAGFCLAATSDGQRCPSDMAAIAFEDTEGGASAPNVSHIVKPLTALGTTSAETIISMMLAERWNDRTFTLEAAFTDDGGIPAKHNPHGISARDGETAGTANVSEPLTLNLITADFRDFDDRIAAFRRAHPETGINIIDSGGSHLNFDSYWKRRRSGQDMPDVLVTEYRFIPQFVEENILRDISSLPFARSLADRFLPSCWNAVRYRSGLWGIPMDHDTIVMFYRKDILDSFGFEPARTWEGLRWQCAAIQAEHPELAMSPLIVAHSAHLVALLTMQGARPWLIDDKAGRIRLLLDTPRVRAAFQLIQDSLDEGVLVPIERFNMPETHEMLRQGRFVCPIHGNWLSGIIERSCAGVEGEWKVTLPPSFSEPEHLVTATVGGQAFTFTRHMDPAKLPAAIQFALWMQIGPDSLRKYPAWGLSPLASVQRNQQALSIVPPFFNQQVYHTYFESTQLLAEDPQYFPFTAFLEASFRNEIKPSLVAGGTVTEHLARWQRQLASYAESRGYDVSIG